MSDSALPLYSSTLPHSQADDISAFSLQSPNAVREVPLVYGTQLGGLIESLVGQVVFPAVAVSLARTDSDQKFYTATGTREARLHVSADPKFSYSASLIDSLGGGAVLGVSKAALIDGIGRTPGRNATLYTKPETDFSKIILGAFGRTDGNIPQEVTALAPSTMDTTLAGYLTMPERELRPLVIGSVGEFDDVEQARVIAQLGLLRWTDASGHSRARLTRFRVALQARTTVDRGSEGWTEMP